MRQDMNKVLIERPRVGGRGKQRKRFDKITRGRERRYFKGVAVDLRPKKESMRKKHKINGDYKEFTDLIGPLEKFLFSRVGQPWNDVWSEICAVLKGNGLQAQHVKGHVKQMVGGIPHSGETYFRDDDWFAPGSRYGRCVYVDEDGILQKSEGSSWRKQEKKRYPYYRESDTIEYHKLNGCWFRVEIGSYVGEKKHKGYFRDYYVKETCYYVINKKALSRKETKKLALDQKFETISPKLTLE